MTARPCIHCRYLLDPVNGRWLDRDGNGWCPGALLPHTPAPLPPREARRSDPLLTSGGLR